MKKAMVIAASVAAYSLFEAAILLGLLYPGRPEVVAGWALVLVIPGNAALISRLTYGNHRWLRRTLMIVIGILGLPILLTLLLLIGAFLGWVFTVSEILFYTLLPIALGAGCVGLFFGFRSIRRRSIQLNAEGRLEEIQSGRPPSDRKWKNRAIHLGSCIPVITVLFVFLFLPELWGAVTHIAQPHAGELAGYQVRIPVGWIIMLSTQSVDGESFAGGVHLQGIGFGVRPYMEWGVPIGSWNVGTGPYSQANQKKEGSFDGNVNLPPETRVLSRRTLKVDGEEVTCIEYWPERHYLPLYPEESSVTYLRCLGSGRLHAYFAGEKMEAPNFYKMLEGTRRDVTPQIFAPGSPR